MDPRGVVTKIVEPQLDQLVLPSSAQQALAGVHPNQVGEKGENVDLHSPSIVSWVSAPCSLGLFLTRFSNLETCQHAENQNPPTASQPRITTQRMTWRSECAM